MGVTEYQLAIENAIAEDWELVKDTAGRVNTAAEIFPLAYRFGWHAARKHVGYTSADERIRQLEKLNATLAAEVDRQRLVMNATTMVLEYQYRVSDSFAWRAIDDLRLALLAYQASKRATPNEHDDEYRLQPETL